MDDISVITNNTEILVNGGFETGSLAPWIRTPPTGACSGIQAAEVSNAPGVPRTGSYGMRDGIFGCVDQISQSFSVTEEQTYLISFWLKSSNGLVNRNLR